MAHTLSCKRPGSVTVRRWRRRSRSACSARHASGATARPCPSIRARRPRCWRTSRWPSGRARARRFASCSGPRAIPSTRAVRCGGRCRRCARRSARSGSTRRPTASRCATARAWSSTCVASVRSGRRVAGGAGGRGRAVPRRAARGVRPARQPRVRRLAAVRGGRAAARAERRAGAAGGGARRGRRPRPGARPRAPAARARPAARAGAPRADPPLRAQRRPRRRARPVPRLRPDAHPGAGRGSGRGDGRAVRAGQRGRRSRRRRWLPRARPATAAPSELPLVGRDRQLEALLQAQRDAGDGGRLAVHRGRGRHRQEPPGA